MPHHSGEKSKPAIQDHNVFMSDLTREFEFLVALLIEILVQTCHAFQVELFCFAFRLSLFVLQLDFMFRFFDSMSRDLLDCIIFVSSAKGYILECFTLL